jgi:hypothetical protein
VKKSSVLSLAVVLALEQTLPILYLKLSQIDFVKLARIAEEAALQIAERNSLTPFSRTTLNGFICGYLKTKSRTIISNYTMAAVTKPQILKSVLNGAKQFSTSTKVYFTV